MPIQHMAARPRGNSELLVIMIEPVLAHADLFLSREARTNGGARTVGGDRGGEGCFIFDVVRAVGEEQNVSRNGAETSQRRFTPVLGLAYVGKILSVIFLEASRTVISAPSAHL